MHRARISISILLAPLLYVVGVLANQGSAADVSALNQEVGRANNESLLWGPYKPNLYFGVRPRLPNSLSAGLMWSKVEDYNSVQRSKYLLQDCRNAAPFSTLSAMVILC